MSKAPRTALLQRLLSAKQFLLHGGEHLLRDTPFDRVLAILHFDNAVETALKAVADQNTLHVSRRAGFDELWKIVESLPVGLQYGQQISALHEARNASQHRGEIPSKESAKEHQYWSQLFIEGVLKDYFQLTLGEILAASEVRNDVLRDYLGKSEKCLQEGQWKSAVNMSAEAFTYLTRKVTLILQNQRLPLLRIQTSPSLPFSWQPYQSFGQIESSSDKRLDELSSAMTTLSHDWHELETWITSLRDAFLDVLTILVLDIDYGEFLRFTAHAPFIFPEEGANRYGYPVGVEYDEAIARFCFGFALRAVLRAEPVWRLDWEPGKPLLPLKKHPRERDLSKWSF